MSLVIAFAHLIHVVATDEDAVWRGISAACRASGAEMYFSMVQPLRTASRPTWHASVWVERCVRTAAIDAARKAMRPRARGAGR